MYFCVLCNYSTTLNHTKKNEERNFGESIKKDAGIEKTSTIRHLALDYFPLDFSY